MFFGVKQVFWSAHKYIRIKKFNNLVCKTDLYDSGLGLSAANVHDQFRSGTSIPTTHIAHGNVGPKARERLPLVTSPITSSPFRIEACGRDTSLDLKTDQATEACLLLLDQGLATDKVRFVNLVIQQGLLQEETCRRCHYHTGRF